jgi:hypothetical protein
LRRLGWLKCYPLAWWFQWPISYRNYLILWRLWSFVFPIFRISRFGNVNFGSWIKIDCAGVHLFFLALVLMVLIVSVNATNFSKMVCKDSHDMILLIHTNI